MSYQNLQSLEQRQPIAVAVTNDGEIVARQFAGCNVGGTGYMPYTEGEEILRALREEGIPYQWVDA